MDPDDQISRDIPLAVRGYDYGTGLPEVERVSAAAEELRAAISRLRPGEKLHVERHKDEGPSKALFTARVQEYPGGSGGQQVRHTRRAERPEDRHQRLSDPLG